MANQIKKKYLAQEVISYFDDQIEVVDTAVTGLQSEKADKSYVDAQDDAKLLEAKSYSDSAVLTEKNRAELAESGLQSQITTEKNRVDAILDASQADKDSFAEIVNLINSVDLENDNALASAVLSINSNITAEEAARIAGDNALDVRIDAIESLEPRVAALEQYKQETVWVDPVVGVDASGRGSMMRPYRTINYAYSQVQSLGAPSNTTYNSNVEKFVTEKLVIHLAPGRYTEDVVLGFKRARVRLVGDGATIIGNVKMSVKLADFPASNLENMKNSFPAPYTGGSAFMNFEIVGKSGGGLESDPTANVLVITGTASLAFEETTVPGSGVIFPNWDGSFGQFYAYLDGASMGNFVVTTSHNAATPTLPAGVIEVESCNIAAANQTYRQHFGIVPYAYLTDFATWNTTTKGTTNKAPSGTWTLKAHNSTFGNVIGPRLTIGEMDGCRIYDIDRTMRGTVDNGAISGSTSTSYLGLINNQFRIFSGSGDLASAYKLGQSSGSTRYKIDSVSYTTLAFSRNSSGVLSARTLDVGAGVSYDLLDDARSIFVNDPATNYTRSSNTVDSALEGIDAALGNKANSSDLTSIQSSVTSLNSSVSSLNTRMSTAESNITSLQSGKLDSSAVGVSVASLVSGKIPASQIPAVALTETYIVTSEAEMLALSQAQQGDVAVRTDLSKSFILVQNGSFSNLSDWIELKSPTFDQTGLQNQIDALDLRIDALESTPSVVLQKDAPKIIGSGDLSFVDLEFLARANSINAFIGRLALHEGVDYTLSEVGGKTRLTWIGSMVNPGGAEAIQEGDRFYANYIKA